MRGWLWPRWCACVRPCVPRWAWRGRAPGGAGASPAPVSPDTDDCADAPCCQQACTNSPGGYECSCYAGYRLSADGCGCEGEGPGGGSTCLRPASERRLSARLSGPACSLPSLRSLASLTEWGLHPWLLAAWPPAGRVSAVTPTLGGEGDGCSRGVTQQHGHRASGQSWALGASRGPRPGGWAPAALVCPQTWTSVRPAAVAASITVPTWPAPSAAPARPASCWTRTAGAAPVSTSPQGCCPEHRAPDFSAPAFLAGRPSPQPCPHCGTRQGGSGGIRGRSDRHLQSGQSGPAAGLLSKRRDIIPGAEDSVQRGRELLPSPPPMLRVPRAKVGAWGSLGPGALPALRSRLRRAAGTSLPPQRPGEEGLQVGAQGGGP